MDDNQTAAPAGDGAQPVSDTSALSLDDAVAMLGPDKKQDKEEIPAKPADEPAKPAKPADAPADELADEPADEAEPAADEAEQPDGEPSEPEPEPEPDEEVHGNAKTRLRDGTIVAVADLKKAYGELQDLKRSLPATETKLRQEVEQERTQTQQKSKVLDELLPLAVQAVQSQLPPEPDPALWETDPVDALQQQRRHDAALARLQQLKQAQEAQAAEQHRARDDAVKAFVHEQQARLLETRPQLRDPKNAEAFYRDYVVAPAKSVGFTEAEINNTYDHRLILLAEKAAKWDRHEAEAKAARPKVAEKSKDAVPVQAPARRASPAERQDAEVESLSKQLSKTGEFDFALAILNKISAPPRR